MDSCSDSCCKLVKTNLATVYKAARLGNWWRQQQSNDNISRSLSFSTLKSSCLTFVLLQHSIIIIIIIHTACQTRTPNLFQNTHTHMHTSKFNRVSSELMMLICTTFHYYCLLSFATNTDEWLIEEASSFYLSISILANFDNMCT